LLFNLQKKEEHMANNKGQPVKFYRPHKKKKRRLWPKILIGGIAIVVIGVAIFYGKAYYDRQHLQQISANFQRNALKQKITTANEKNRATNIDYDSKATANVPTATQLANNRKLPGSIYLNGYVSVPVQQGVTRPISLPIYEGTTDKVLAYGAGTLKPGQMMGKNNYAIAAHNFANNVTYFSPIQRSIDVTQKPKAYLSDGHKIYTYELSKRYVVDFTHGEVANDHNQAQITMITCDEPGLLNLYPENRVIITGKLTQTQAFDQATQKMQNLFTAK
jgi:sortase A